MIFINCYFVDYQIYVIFVKGRLIQNIVENFKYVFCGSVYSYYGIIFIHRQLQLVFQSLYSQGKLVDHFGVGFLNDLCTIRVTHYISCLLTCEHFHFSFCVLDLSFYQLHD